MLALYPRPHMPTRCMEWQAAACGGGYGKAKFGGRTVSAHRLAWEVWNGPIPEGMWVLHKCDNPICCRADHLYLGTPADNSADMVRKGRSKTGRVPYNVRRRICADDRTPRVIAEHYGVSQMTVYRIKRAARPF